ncbi:MAG TPA: serine hydrolase [Desulfuromonadales bacterium]|nr:serine hydrolase [Desulfuromonadales bacterium]
MTGKLFSLIAGILLVSLLAGFTYPEQVKQERIGAEAYHLGYADPRTLGIDPDKLKKIDAIVEEAIREGATPGAVVTVLKDGKIVFDRAYGHHAYDGAVPTQSSDIFDLASVTKIFATTLAAMRLVDQGKLDLDARVGKYLGELKHSHPDKAAIRVRDLLTHRAGFIPFIPFFLKIKDGDYSPKPSSRYPVKVAEGFFLTKDYYKKVMWKRMLESPLKTPGKYVYSDISMFMLKEILERIVRKPLDVYVNEQFYKPLGACSIGFCPLDRFAEERIVPTEGDTYFRKQQLKGFVQDPGAAMAGGVSGHAGLFATAYDLAILSQMLLNGGSYNGRQYIKPETVKKFSSRQSEDSRRGLGFDCWDPESEKGYPCQLASPETFGHTGFTGTCVWIDPEHRLVYIFLSNRLYPSPDKNKLMKLNIRPRIHDVIYEAMGTGTGRTTAVDP